MVLWQSPFNKIVRSHEAGIVGLLSGIMIGVVAMIYVPVVVTERSLDYIPTYCQDTPESVSFSYTGEIVRVNCKDGRVLVDF